MATARDTELRPRFLSAHACSVALAAFALCAAAPCTQAKQSTSMSPAPAVSNETPEAEEALVAQRVAKAKETGVWIVQEGDHLYRIARSFFPTDRVRIERMREQLVALNSQAFMAGKPGLLIVGAKLRLPMELITAGADRVVSASPVAATSIPGAPNGKAVAAGAASGRPAQTGQTPAPAPVFASGTPGQTVITRLDPNEPNARPAPVRVAPTYQDKVIEGVSQEDESVHDADPGSQPAGRRTLSLGHSQAIRDRSGGRSRDQSIDLRLSFETMNHGDFRLDSQWIHFTPTAQDLLPRRQGFNATLYHSQFPLPGGVTADSALGVVRSLQPIWLTSSQRVVLPSTLLSGFTTRLGGESGELRLAIGEPGRLAGIGILDFERTGGRFASVSGSLAPAKGWQIGGALLRLTDSTTIADHTSGTAAIDFAPSTRLRGKAQLLLNNGGRRGAWSDWEFNQDRWRHRAGAYQMDPDLLYGDSRPQNDVRGVYWRSELRLGFNSYAVGAESSHTNIRNDVSRAGTGSDGVYANMSLRLDRSTSVGGGVSVRKDRPRQGTGAERDVVIANAFASRQSDLGFTRVDGTVNDTRSIGQGDERITTVQLSHDFPRWNQLSVATAYAATREDMVDGSTNRRVASLSLRGPLIGAMAWDASLAWVDVDGEGQSERGYNANVGIDWPISANWAANLSWQRNQVRPGADNPLNPFRRENTVLLSVRYDAATGVPHPRAIGPAGRQGTGTLVGHVFYDENGDGIRQPSERGAENILLVLDGRFPATTNRDGYYSFGPVALGTHSVAVQLERVPLPWGLADETPRQVVIRLREESRIDIGLTRISP